MSELRLLALCLAICTSTAKPPSKVIVKALAVFFTGSWCQRVCLCDPPQRWCLHKEGAYLHWPSGIHESKLKKVKLSKEHVTIADLQVCCCNTHEADLQASYSPVISETRFPQYPRSSDRSPQRLLLLHPMRHRRSIADPNLFPLHKIFSQETPK